jgi:hypothetical protein
VFNLLPKDAVFFDLGHWLSLPHRVARGQDAHADDQHDDPGQHPGDALTASAFPFAGAETVRT